MEHVLLFSEMKRHRPASPALVAADTTSWSDILVSSSSVIIIRNAGRRARGTKRLSVPDEHDCVLHFS